MSTNLHKFLNQGSPLDERHGFGYIPRLQSLAYNIDPSENPLLFHMDGDDFGDQTKNTIFTAESTEVTEIFLRNVRIREIKNSGNFVQGRNQNHETSHLQERVLESGLSHGFGLVLKPISSVFNAFKSPKSAFKIHVKINVLNVFLPFTSANSAVKTGLNAFQFQLSIFNFQLNSTSKNI